jgi:hypothetical protein
MATLNTYRASVLIKAGRSFTQGEQQRRRHLALRTDGYILRRDSAYTGQGWRSPGWKMFRRKKDDSTWPDFARDFMKRLSTYSYRVTFMAESNSLTSYGFSAEMRRELASLKSAKPKPVAGEEDDRPAGSLAEVKPREKSRYRLWICPKCHQKIRAGTDNLKATCDRCQKVFIRKD